MLKELDYLVSRMESDFVELLYVDYANTGLYNENFVTTVRAIRKAQIREVEVTLEDMYKKYRLESDKERYKIINLKLITDSEILEVPGDKLLLYKDGRLMIEDGVIDVYCRIEKVYRFITSCFLSNR